MMRRDVMVLVAVLLVSGSRAAQGASESTQDQTAIGTFAKDTAVQALDYTQGDRQSLMDAQPQFTPDGWDEFMKPLSGWLDDTSAPSGSSHFTPTGDPVTESPTSGVFHVTIPGTLIQSQNGSSTTYQVAADVWVGGSPMKVTHLQPIVHRLGSGKHPAETALSPSEKQFLDAYIAATRSGDPNRMKTLIHPKSLACMVPADQDYYDTILGKLAQLPVPEHYELHVESVDPAMMQKRLFFFWGPDASLPAMPTKEIRIQYSQKDDAPRHGCKKFHEVADKEVMHMLDLVEDAGHLSMVIGCAGPQTLEKFRQKPQREAEAAAHAAALLRQVPPELRARLTNLITTGRTLNAIQTYQAESKQTLTESADVLDQLCDEL